MKFIVAALFLLTTSLLQAQIEVPRSTSPDGRFMVTMEFDRDSPGYELDTVPKMWLVDTKTKQRLVDFYFMADPNSDEQPFRNKVRCVWSANEANVAIQFSERFYTYMEVYKLKVSEEGTESFEKCLLLPDNEIIPKFIPNLKEFRSRWYVNPEGWIDQNTLIYSAGSGVITEPLEGAIETASFRFYVNYRYANQPRLIRIEPTGEDTD